MVKLYFHNYGTSIIDFICDIKLDFVPLRFKLRHCITKIDNLVNKSVFT